MRRFAIVLALTLSLSACTIWKEPKLATWKNTTSLEAMERLLWQEIQAGNWVEVEAHMASNYTNGSENGMRDKAQTTEQLRQLKLLEFSLGDFAVTDHADTSVITYTALFKGTQGGQQFGPMHRRRMSVWQKLKSGWVLVAQADLGEVRK